MKPPISVFVLLYSITLLGRIDRSVCWGDSQPRSGFGYQIPSAKQALFHCPPMITACRINRSVCWYDSQPGSEFRYQILSAKQAQHIDIIASQYQDSAIRSFPVSDPLDLSRCHWHQRVCASLNTRSQYLHPCRLGLLTFQHLLFRPRDDIRFAEDSPHSLVLLHGLLLGLGGFRLLEDLKHRLELSVLGKNGIGKTVVEFKFQCLQASNL